MLQAIRSRRSGGVPRPQRTHGSLRRLGAAQGGGLWVALILLSLYFSWTTGSFLRRPFAPFGAGPSTFAIDWKSDDPRM